MGGIYVPPKGGSIKIDKKKEVPSPYGACMENARGRGALKKKE